MEPRITRPCKPKQKVLSNLYQYNNNPITIKLTATTKYPTFGHKNDQVTLL